MQRENGDTTIQQQQPLSLPRERPPFPYPTMGSTDGTESNDRSGERPTQYSTAFSWDGCCKYAPWSIHNNNSKKGQKLQQSRQNAFWFSRCRNYDNKLNTPHQHTNRPKRIHNTFLERPKRYSTKMQKEHNCNYLWYVPTTEEEGIRHIHNTIAYYGIQRITVDS